MTYNESAAETPAFLSATGLRKSFGGLTAVDGLSFDIGKQEIFGLLGPNGAGKTTTIRMLSTVLAPDEGDVTIGGHSVTRESDAVRRLVGVCPQELALYPELSATDNLVFFGRMAGLSGREAKQSAAEYLEVVGLTERARDKVDKFSGGMKRRVNLAVALMSRPQLLFLDRADGRHRPAVAEPHFRDGGGPAGRGHDRALHHALHGGGRPPLRPAGHHGPRADAPAGPPRASQSGDRKPGGSDAGDGVPGAYWPEPAGLIYDHAKSPPPGPSIPHRNAVPATSRHSRFRGNPEPLVSRYVISPQTPGIPAFAGIPV